MAVAWAFSVALVKHFEQTLPYFTQRRLDRRVHNKALQKGRESLRIDGEILLGLCRKIANRSFHHILFYRFFSIPIQNGISHRGQPVGIDHAGKAAFVDTPA